MSTSDKQASRLIITGTVSRSTYESLKNYIIQPVFKLLSLVLIVGYDAWMLVQLIQTRTPANLVLIVVFTALMIFLHFHSRKSIVKRAVSSHEELRRGGAFDLTIHMGDEGVRMFNQTLGRERNMTYAEFKSYADTPRCIALFVKGGNYLMIPKDNMDEALHDQVMELLHEKCPKLHKRL